MTWTLRAFAILIAVGGLIDPAFTIAGRTPARVAVVVQDSPTMDLPAVGGMTRRELAERARARLVRDLGDDYEILPRLTSSASTAVVIGDSYPPRCDRQDELRSDLEVATVTVAGDVVPNVRVAGVDAPREVPAGTAIRVGVDVEGAGVAGRTSTLTVRAGGLEVGRATHDWHGDRDRWHADIDAVPIGEPPFALRVEVQPLDVERTSIDNAADAVVAARRPPLRVDVYEPRPSWATTFIRRALEDDARFRVAGVTATAKAVATRTGNAISLSSSALDELDVIVVGGLDRLTATDARALDRFMRARGGAVVIAPDARVGAGAAAALLRGLTLTERLSERPEKLTATAPLAPIQASELLTIRSDARLTERLAWTAGAAPATVIVSTPRGDGRLVVSGALDAWRYRTEDGGAFDRFWQSTIAGLALGVRPPLDVTVEPPMLRPGERGEVVVRVRDANARGVSAAIDGRPVRLWPDAQARVFRGSFIAPDTSDQRTTETPALRDADRRSTIVAKVDGASPLSASRAVVVRADVRRPLPATAPLSLLSASHHGIDGTADNLVEVERFVRRTVAGPVAPVTRHPMRSGWWMIPFAACLSAEWYLRRRRGLR